MSKSLSPNDALLQICFAVDRPEAEYLLVQIESSLRALSLGGTLGMTDDQKNRLRLKYSAVEKLGKALTRAMGDEEGHD